MKFHSILSSQGKEFTVAGPSVVALSASGVPGALEGVLGQ
jgi:hypothetical protein